MLTKKVTVLLACLLSIDGLALYANTYSASGNMVIGPQQQHDDYNAQNQLTQVQTPHGQTVSFGYFANGMRANENNPTWTVMRCYYDNALGQITNTLQGTAYTSYLRGNHLTLRFSLAAPNSAQVMVVNRQKSVISRITAHAVYPTQYSVYGKPTLTNPSIGYDGYLWDQAAEVYYLKARYYDPSARTFLTRDTANLHNRYWYGNDHPLAGYDPSGHMFEEDLLPTETESPALLISQEEREARIKKSATRPHLSKKTKDTVYKRDAGMAFRGDDRSPCKVKRQQRTANKAENWDMGHRPGFEYRDLRKLYVDGRISGTDLVREYNDPEHYRVESATFNQSHQGETDDINYYAALGTVATPPKAPRPDLWSPDSRTWKPRSSPAKPFSYKPRRLTF